MDRECAPVVPGWQVLRCLGRGRSGDVFLGRCEDRRWAGLRRLVRAPVDVAVRCAHLVGVHELIEVADGWVAVIDLVEAGTLARHVQARGRLTAGELITVLTPLAATLAQLHTAGRTHGLVDAQHVLLTRVGRPVFTDLAGAHAHPSRSVASTDDVLGLGLIGWRALAGSQPEHAWSRIPLGERARSVPAGLVEVVEACADPDPSSRPNAADVPALLAGLASPEPLFPAHGDDPAERVTRRIPSRFLRVDRPD